MVTNIKPSKPRPAVGLEIVQNRLLASLLPADRALIEPHLEFVELAQGTSLFEPGDDVTHTYFPSAGTMVSFVLVMRDGRAVEAATIGREGAVGGIVSSGFKPAFARAAVQIPGSALRLGLGQLDEAKQRSATLRDLFSRYADVLLAQVLQSVACNARHSLQERCCRWLLTVHDRVAADQIALTQEALSEMLGVQRTTLTAIARRLQAKGFIQYSRGRILIKDRPGLERESCECYDAVSTHWERVLPEVKPQAVTQ